MIKKNPPFTPTRLRRMTPQAGFTLWIYFYGGLRELSVGRSGAAERRRVERAAAPLA